MAKHGIQNPQTMILEKMTSSKGFQISSDLLANNCQRLSDLIEQRDVFDSARITRLAIALDDYWDAL